MYDPHDRRPNRIRSRTSAVAIGKRYDNAGRAVESGVARLSRAGGATAGVTELALLRPEPAPQT